MLAVTAEDGPLRVGFAVVLWGTAFAAIQTCIQIWTYRAAPERFEAGSALMVTSYQTSMFIGAWGGGLMVDSHGLRGAFALAAVLSLCCTIPILLASRKASGAGVCENLP